MESAVDTLIKLRQDGKTLSLEEKIRMKSELEKNKPDLQLCEKDGRSVRRFQVKWYDAHPWLVGSQKRKKMYCFPCLLFNSFNIWSSEGVDKIKNFLQKVRKHEVSCTHIRNFEEFLLLGRVKIDCKLDSLSKRRVIEHNAKVEKNRRYLSRLIDAVIYLRGHREDNNSLNYGHFVELLNLFAMEESFVADQLQSSRFKGTSSEVQNELIACVSSVVTSRIKTEIESVRFVSVQVDETTDVVTKAQLSIIVRYCKMNGNVIERFLGFYDVPRNKKAENLASVVLDVLCEFNCKEKLISQTYDGASIMAGTRGGVQAIVRNSCPSAVFVHCYAHQLNLVLLHGSKKIKDVKRFISDLTSFRTFFNRSTNRSELLREHGFKLPHPSEKQWNYHSRAVSTIKEHFRELYLALKYVDEADFDPVTTSCSYRLVDVLENFKFRFLLILYSNIFIFVNHLFNILQNKVLSHISMCITEVEACVQNIASLRCFNQIKMYFLEANELVGAENKANAAEDEMTRIAFEIIDSIVNHIKLRFKGLNDLCFVELFNEKEFPSYDREFPDLKFKKMISIYSHIFDSDKLRGELINLYGNQDKHLPPSVLLNFILQNDLECVYTETCKALRLILTVPLISVSRERSTNILKRVKDQLKSNMLNPRLSVLSTISIEKELTLLLRAEPSFKNEVIERFAAMGDRGLDFTYKNIL